MSLLNTIVVGGGPGGAAAALYLARFCHDVTVFDASPSLKGRTVWAYHLENLIGLKKPIDGAEFVKETHEQLRRFNVSMHCDEEVVNVKRRQGSGFWVETKSGRFESKFVVIAVGVQDILPSIPNIEQYYGHSLFSCPTCNWYQAKNLPVAIIANDDQGILEALVFTSMQSSPALYVVPDRPQPQFSTPMLKKAKKAGIKVFSSPVLTLNGEPEHLRSISLANCTQLEVSALFTKLGVRRTDTFLSPDLNLIRDKDGYIEVNFQSMESSIENLFAVGPCNSGPDQVMVAGGQGITAAMEIHRRILASKGL